MHLHTVRAFHGLLFWRLLLLLYWRLLVLLTRASRAAHIRTVTSPLNVLFSAILIHFVSLARLLRCVAVHCSVSRSTFCSRSVMGQWLAVVCNACDVRHDIIIPPSPPVSLSATIDKVG
ncbi:hypothetical protein PLICRDRAFT_526208 [Plicaturopsis crispa FD-325 SS-3]|nr:hypothetical protein PLICRDRAFT_526208 [Plicaturopsis crispa FD-325 SS-3]